MAETVSASSASIDPYLHFPEPARLDAQPMPTGSCYVDDIPGAVASISGRAVPPSPNANYKDSGILFVQQDVLARVGRVLDDPVLTPSEQTRRFEELRDQSELGVLMFRTVYNAALLRRRSGALRVAHFALGDWARSSRLAET